MSYTKTLFQGIIVMVSGLGLAAVFAYLTRLFLAHRLTIEELGLFFSILSLVLLFDFLRDFGLNQAVAKFIPEYLVKKKYSKISSIVLSTFFFQLLFSILLIIILWLFADFLGEHYFHNIQAAYFLKVLSFYLFFSTIFANTGSLFRGFKKPILGLVQSSKNTLIFALTVLLVGIYGVLGAIYAYVFSGIIFTLLFIIPIFKTFNFFKHPPTHIFKNFKKIFLFSLPFIAVSASANIISQLDTLMLTYFSTLEAVGVYSVVIPTVNILMIVSTAIGSFFMPIISELWTKKDFNLISSGTNILYRFTLLGVVPLTLVLFSYAEFFLRTFFGNEFIPGTVAFQILIVAIIAKIFFGLNGQFLSGIGKPKYFMYAMIFGGVANIFLNFLLIPPFGIEGAAFATGISFFLVAAHSFFHVNKSVSLVHSLKQVPFVVLAAFGFLGTVTLVKELLSFTVYLEIFLSFFTGALVYLSLILFFKLVSFEEIKSLLAQVKPGAK